MNEYKFKGEFVSVSLEKDSTGKIREKVFLRDSVNVLLRCGDRFIFLKERRWEVGGRFSTPKLLSGLLEKGEDAEGCAKREVKEELNVEVNTIELVFLYTQNGTINQNKYYYVADVDLQSGKARVNLEEFTEQELISGLVGGVFGITTTGSVLKILATIKSKSTIVTP